MKKNKDYTIILIISALLFILVCYTITKKNSYITFFSEIDIAEPIMMPMKQYSIQNLTSTTKYVLISEYNSPLNSNTWKRLKLLPNSPPQSIMTIDGEYVYIINTENNKKITPVYKLEGGHHYLLKTNPKSEQTEIIALE